MSSSLTNGSEAFRSRPASGVNAVVESAVKAIVKAAKTGAIGDGIVFISTIDEALRIRTEEEGEKAI